MWWTMRTLTFWKGLAPWCTSPNLRHCRWGHLNWMAKGMVTQRQPSHDRPVRLLPMSAPIQGVSGRLWADQWLEVIEKAGVQIETGKPLLPGRTWHTLPQGRTSCLQRLRQNEAAKTWHLPSTRQNPHLSWMAKWGTSPDVLRLKCATMMIYGKDNTSAGLRERNTITDAIRSDEFRPDLPRLACSRRVSWQEMTEWTVARTWLHAAPLPQFFQESEWCLRIGQSEHPVRSQIPTTTGSDYLTVSPSNSNTVQYRIKVSEIITKLTTKITGWSDQTVRKGWTQSSWPEFRTFVCKGTT